MKTPFLILLTAVGTALAQTAVTTTTTMTGAGTLVEYTPGTAFVVKETSGPVKYTYGDSVTYVTKSGTTLTAEQAQARIRVGMPVSVGYTTVGEARQLSRIEIDDGKIEIEKD